MPAYLLTWNPKKYPWEHLSKMAAGTAEGEPAEMDWSTGRRKNVGPGDRLFLMRVGKKPKGIVAVGTATTRVYQGDHWDGTPGKTANYVDGVFDRIVDPAVDTPLDVMGTSGKPPSRMHWTPEEGGVLIPEDVAEWLEIRWADHTGTIDRTTADILADPDADTFPEGRMLFRMHRLRERNREVIEQAKALALRRRGKLSCCVCRFDFAAVYGPLGEGYIEGHHITPLSRLTGVTQTRVSDIALVCANCHRMLHRRRPWLGTVDELRSLLKT